MKKMKNFGWNHKDRIEVLKSAKNGYSIMVEKDDSGEAPLYRPHDYKKKERESCFKAGDKFESVLFVPATPGAKLKKLVEDKIKSLELKVRVVEKPGAKLVRGEPR